MLDMLATLSRTLCSALKTRQALTLENLALRHRLAVLQRWARRPRMRRRMVKANPLWGAPRSHGELLNLGIDVSERTVSRCMPSASRNRIKPTATLLL
jgi:hypothetical protein